MIFSNCVIEWYGEGDGPSQLSQQGLANLERMEAMIQFSGNGHTANGHGDEAEEGMCICVHSIQGKGHTDLVQRSNP